MHQVIISITRESESLDVTLPDGSVTTLHPDGTSQTVVQWEHGEQVTLAPTAPPVPPA